MLLFRLPICVAIFIEIEMIAVCNVFILNVVFFVQFLSINYSAASGCFDLNSRFILLFVYSITYCSDLIFRI